MFKIVISDPKSKKAYQKEIEEKASGLLGKKIGEKFSGNSLGLTGYELVITGGSDKDGFPMRPDVDGQARKKILIHGPPGFHPKLKGQRRKKSVRGNTISLDVSQINTKVVSHGQKSLEELLGVKAKEKAEKKEQKAEPSKGEKPETESKQEERSAEKKKEGVKTEEKAVEEKGPEEAKGKESKAEKPREKTEKKPEEPKKEEKPPEEKMGVKDLEKKEKEVKKG